jgi:glycosyltransferase involved in cell wall biosynthesis
VTRALAWIGRQLLAPPGWAAGAMSRRWRNRTLFMFFATPAMGGAERVHAQIVEAVADYHPVVVFSEAMRDNELLPLYEQHVAPVFLHSHRRSRVREYFNEARIAAEINRAREPVVFGAFSHFFYRLLPKLHRDIRCVDLIHNFGVQFEHFSLPHAERLDARVVLSERIKSELASLYDVFGVVPGCDARIRVVPNGVPVPSVVPAKPEGPLNILYVGRSTPEKRVHLVGEIAVALAARGVDATVTLVGDVQKSVPDEASVRCRFEGLVTDPARLNALYDSAHLLLLTSSREGLPMAMLEGMARGAVPLVPAVGAIPDHVQAGTSGVLLDVEPESVLVKQAADAIARLAGHRGALAAMSRAAHAHVAEKCSDGVFREAWRDVLVRGRDA